MIIITTWIKFSKQKIFTNIHYFCSNENKKKVGGISSGQGKRVKQGQRSSGGKIWFQDRGQSNRMFPEQHRQDTGIHHHLFHFGRLLISELKHWSCFFDSPEERMLGWDWAVISSCGTKKDHTWNNFWIQNILFLWN